MKHDKMTRVQPRKALTTEPPEELLENLQLPEEEEFKVIPPREVTAGYHDWIANREPRSNLRKAPVLSEERLARKQIALEEQREAALQRQIEEEEFDPDRVEPPSSAGLGNDP